MHGSSPPDRTASGRQPLLADFSAPFDIQYRIRYKSKKKLRKGVKEMYIFFKKNSCINMNSMILKRKFVVWLSYY